MSHTKLHHLVTATAIVLAVTSVVHAQSTSPAWLDRLSAQLATEKECKVEYFLNIKEGEMAGRLTLEARAQCTDGRQFDGSLTQPAEKFTISQCGVQVC